MIIIPKTEYSIGTSIRHKTLSMCLHVLKTYSSIDISILERSHSVCLGTATVCNGLWCCYAPAVILSYAPLLFATSFDVCAAEQEAFHVVRWTVWGVSVPQNY